jgi:(1->4)-alpha-D-glucan 1-alpha-D-glucosylmutase
VFTSWINPSERHEEAMTRFIEQALAPDNAAFRTDFLEFQQRVARYGIYNSLAQVAVKIGAPGVPDFYQGTELWDFSLVDPDNRRPVDYERRRALVAELSAAAEGEDAVGLVTRLLATPGDDRLKLFVTMTLLRVRRDRRELFQNGGYEPLVAGGVRGEHVFAFARAAGEHRLIVAVPRLIATLVPEADAPVGDRVWGDTWIPVPAGGTGAYRHVLTQRTVEPRPGPTGPALRAAEVFEHFPIAVLEARA